MNPSKKYKNGKKNNKKKNVKNTQIKIVHKKGNKIDEIKKKTGSFHKYKQDDCKNIICFNSKCTYKHNKNQIELRKSYFDGLFYLKKNIDKIKDKNLLKNTINEIKKLEDLCISTNNVNKKSKDYVQDLKNNIGGSPVRNTITIFLNFLNKEKTFNIIT